MERGICTACGKNYDTSVENHICDSNYQLLKDTDHKLLKMMETYLINSGSLSQEDQDILQQRIDARTAINQ